jgi:hypothetical protein
VFFLEGLVGKIHKRLEAGIGGRRGFRRKVLPFSLFSFLDSPLSGTVLDTVLDTLLAGEIRQFSGTLRL